MKRIFLLFLAFFLVGIGNSYAYKKYIVNGKSYFFPDVGDQNWGQTVTDWAGAVSSTTFQKSGGTFPLTAEGYFGSNYGLKSIYYKSSSTGVASLGVIRLSLTDSISWRNSNNTGNLSLSVNNQNQLTFNGISIATVSGGANALDTSGSTQTKTGGLVVVGSVTAGAFVGDGGNLFNLSTSNLVGIDVFVSSMNYVIDSLSSTATFAVNGIYNLDASTRSILEGNATSYLNIGNSTETKSGGLNISGTLTANKLVGDGSGITNIGGFVQTESTQTFTGTNTFDNQILVSSGISFPNGKFDGGTISTVAFNSSNTSNDHTNTGESVTITSSGGKIIIIGSIKGNGGTSNMCITRNGTVVPKSEFQDDFGVAGTFTHWMPFFVVDEPPAGSYTYSIKYDIGSPGVYVGGNIIAFELKR